MDHRPVLRPRPETHLPYIWVEFLVRKWTKSDVFNSLGANLFPLPGPDTTTTSTPTPLACSTTMEKLWGTEKQVWIDLCVSQHGGLNWSSGGRGLRARVRPEIQLVITKASAKVHYRDYQLVCVKIHQILVKWRKMYFYFFYLLNCPLICQGIE